MDLKVIFHIDELSKWELVLGNAKRLTEFAEKISKIEVLANSEAVKGYVNENTNPYLQLMTQLSKQGVSFTACNGAIVKFGIQLQQIIPFVKIVPSGVLELAERQADGYAYIKP